MGDGVVALILLIAFIASAILFARRRSSQIDDIERGLPAELRGAVTRQDNHASVRTRRLRAKRRRQRVANRSPQRLDDKVHVHR